MKPKKVKPMSDTKVKKILRHSSRIIDEAQQALATDFDWPAPRIVSYYSNILGIKPEHFGQVTEAYNRMISEAIDKIISTEPIASLLDSI